MTMIRRRVVDIVLQARVGPCTGGVGESRLAARSPTLFLAGVVAVTL